MKKMNDPYNRIIGGNLRRIRRARKLGPQMIAKHLDVSTQQISKYEAGKNRITASALVRVAQYLEINIEELFNGCK